jgi:hypothetical protein
MQNIYVNDTDGWHLVKNLYANDTDGWHLVKNAYVYDTDGWHLAYSAGDSLTETYNTPGTFTYTVPQGVRNLNFQYPTITQINSFNVFNVYPGQEIKVRIGGYGDTSTVYVNTTTYVLPAFNTPVLSFAGNIDSWLNVDFSPVTPTGASVNSATTNNGAQTAAEAAGAIYTVNLQTNHGDLGSTVVMTPVPISVVTNPNYLTLAYNSWSGRNPYRTLSSLTRRGDYYIANFAQNDDPQSNEGYYVFGFNLQQILSVTITPTTPYSSGGVITISPSAITANGIINTLYTIGFTANGGVAPFSWHLDSGVGTINAQTGVWTYTPASVGTKTWRIAVRDSLGATASADYTVNVTAQGTGGGNAGLSITPNALPGSSVGASYNQTITANNGTGLYNWSLVGTLPAGLITTVGGTNNSQFTISGTPTASGSYNITVVVTDSHPVPSTVSQVYGINISQNAPTITTSLSGGTVGTSYGSVTLATSGGVGPYTYTLTAGSLPPGLSFSAGVISGTPTTSGSYNFTIAVRDSIQQTSSKAFSIAVAAAAVPSESLSIFTGFVVSPGGYNSPWAPVVTYNGAGLTNATLNWSFSNGTNTRNGSVGPGNLANGGQIPLSITAPSGSGYTLSVSVGLLTQSVSNIVIN